MVTLLKIDIDSENRLPKRKGSFSNHHFSVAIFVLACKNLIHPMVFCMWQFTPLVERHDFHGSDLQH